MPLPKPLLAGEEGECSVPPQPTRGRIVGIGASAEGLEALEQLFDTLPPDTGLAFVVVQHLSPDVRSFRSMMDAVIARRSNMPIVLAEHNMPVCANHIYLLPPRKQMIIHDRHLVLTGREPQAFSPPIDTFLRSLAQDVGAQAIAIVLSGSGSDGSRGIVEVKRAGGLVLAETAASATFHSMPLSAAATGMVDHTAAPSDLARVLCGVLPDYTIPASPARSDDRDGISPHAEPPVIATARASRAHRTTREIDLAHADEPLDTHLTDSSALDRARAHLAELSAIVESCEDAIIGTTLAGTITIWNRGAERLYGYTAKQAIGCNLRLLMQDGLEVELERHLERIWHGETVEQVRSLCRHRDGIHLEVSTTLLPIHDRRGVITAVSAIGRDISPLLAAERELERRQRRIATLLDQAEDSARRREQFIAMLSHELRNPLAAVMSASAMIMEQTAEQADPASIAHCHAVIERQTRQMKRLLDDLLDVSWITHGSFQLLSDDVDLRVPIELAIESTSPLFAERGVMLDYSLPGQPVPVRGDASRLAQVVANLLSNAATYSPPQTTVRLRVAIRDGQAVLRVTDQGLGIAPELQGKIFELFVQSEQRLDRSRGGLGVGLSLAKRIVDLHGGTIEVHSDGPGKGSEFKVAIPVVPHKVPPWGRGHAPARPSARCRIVLVDDQADSREMLRLLLESRDHVVIDVDDGPAAIDVITREKPDVAFIDIGLPAMNGYEVAQRIRDRPGLDDVLLVALTGYGAPSDIAMARAAGFDEHLVKPAELAKLEKILATKMCRRTE